jgi:5-methylcytosine-specific restriction endonuclease McrA
MIPHTTNQQVKEQDTTSHPNNLFVHVDAAVLADAEHPGQSVLEDGVRVSAETSQRLACDAGRVVMRHDADGRLLEIGARTRTIPPALRRALQHRDRGCRFPGCGLPFGQGHHLRHWAHGGPTTLSNLALLCRRHHRAVHEEGYQVERHPDGALHFRRPDGRPLPDVPSPAAVPDDPVHDLRARHEAQGLGIHPRTACPSWQGERFDVVWAIDVLHPRALECVVDPAIEPDDLDVSGAVFHSFDGSISPDACPGTAEQ